jgi:hypothetical protein
MTGEQLPGLQGWVFAMTKGSFRSREVLEAERPDDVPPYSDDLVLLQNWGTLIDQQGMMLAYLSLVPATRAELKESMPGLLDRSPAWLDARLQGKPLMSWDLFFRGAAQTVAVHRREIERVVAEQVGEPEEIEEALADAPVPAGTDDEDRSDLLSAVSLTMTAHLKALVDIAYHLERNFGRFEIPDVDI